MIHQARRRVLDGQQAPNAEKIYSIFEPHTELIKRGKVRTPVEFGHKVFLAESAKGLITQYELLKGNPADQVHVEPSLKRHRRAFRRVPELYSADRGFFSERNVTACVQGMKRCLAEGAERFALFLGEAVLANNLMTVATPLTLFAPIKSHPINQCRSWAKLEQNPPRLTTSSTATLPGSSKSMRKPHVQRSQIYPNHG